MTGESLDNRRLRLARGRVRDSPGGRRFPARGSPARQPPGLGRHHVFHCGLRGFLDGCPRDPVANRVLGTGSAGRSGSHHSEAPDRQLAARLRVFRAVVRWRQQVPRVHAGRRGVRVRRAGESGGDEQGLRRRLRVRVHGPADDHLRRVVFLRPLLLRHSSVRGSRHGARHDVADGDERRGDVVGRGRRLHGQHRGPAHDQAVRGADDAVGVAERPRVRVGDDLRRHDGRLHRPWRRSRRHSHDQRDGGAVRPLPVEDSAARARRAGDAGARRRRRPRPRTST